MVRIFGNSTDEVWRAFGRDDPYFGVLSHDEYSRENLSTTALTKFFSSGETHIAGLMSSIGRTGITLRTGRALDFGCGVGRLLIPLATRFRHAVGVDVSDGMLAECTNNVNRRKLSNVMLSEQIPDMEFDLVHSALVFQHIDAKRGYNIILDCWSRVASGGLIAIQFPVLLTAGRAAWRLRQIRKMMPILQIPYNILSGSRWNKLGVQMNIYDLNFLSARLLDTGARQIVLLRHDPDLSLFGVYMLAVKA